MPRTRSTHPPFERVLLTGVRSGLIATGKDWQPPDLDRIRGALKRGLSSEFHIRSGAGPSCTEVTEAISGIVRANAKMNSAWLSPGDIKTVTRYVVQDLTEHYHIVVLR